jgi:hypothetical protein
MFNSEYLGLYSKQNFILKCFFILSGILFSLTLNLREFYFIFLLTLIYFIFSPKIYLLWLKTILKLIPFFISLFVFGFILNLSYPKQIILSSRILYILLLSIYLISTTSLENIKPKSKHIKNNQIITEIFFFIAATISFIPIFLQQYKIASVKEKNFFNIISEAVVLSKNKISEVEKETVDKFNKNGCISSFWILPNIYLIFILIIFILIFILFM